MLRHECEKLDNVVIMTRPQTETMILEAWHADIEIKFGKRAVLAFKENSSSRQSSVDVDVLACKLAGMTDLST